MTEAELGELLAQDYTKVQSALTSAHTEELRNKVLDCTATTEEIVEQYHVYDTVEQTAAVVTSMETKDFSKEITNQKRIALADVIGGTTILASEFFKDLVPEDGSTHDFLYGLSTYEPPTEQDKQSVDRLRLAALYVERHPNNTFIRRLTERIGLLQLGHLEGLFERSVISNPESMRRIYMGNVILREGLNNWATADQLAPTQYSEINGHMMRENLIMASLLSGEMTELTIRSGLLARTPEALDIALKEVKVFCGNALSWPTQHDEEYFVKAGELAFTDVCNMLASTADFANETDKDMFKKGRLKGTLHETLWMIDAYAIRKGVPEKYGNLTVTPATEALDMPHLDKPALKRGYDFAISDSTFNPDARRLIQTGASRRKIKNQTETPYHPFIELALEREFNEVNIGTLMKKLDAYRAWATSGFTADGYKKFGIHEKLLDTVKEKFEQ